MIANLPSTSSSSKWLEVRHENLAKPAQDRHSHDFHQVSVTLSGMTELNWWSEDVGHRNLRTKPRRVFINPAHVMHSTHWIGPFDRIILNLNRDVVKRAADELELHGRPDVYPMANGQDDVIWHLAFALFRDLGSDPLSCELYAESIANLLSVRLLRYCASVDSSPVPRDAPFSRKQIAALDEYLLSHLESDLSVTKLATSMGLGPLQFSRRLKATIGMSPYAYITHARVGRACELLATTQRSIAAVAIEVGFSGQSHFSARFRQIIGTTPRAYRDARRTA